MNYVFIVDTFFGIFAIDESGKIINFMNFEEDHEKIVEFYSAIESGIIQIEFENFLFDSYVPNSDELIFDNKDLGFLISEQLDIKTSYNFKSLEIGEIRDKIEFYLKKVGINKTREEILAHDEEIENKLAIRKSH